MARIPIEQTKPYKEGWNAFLETKNPKECPNPYEIDLHNYDNFYFNKGYNASMEAFFSEKYDRIGFIKAIEQAARERGLEYSPCAGSIGSESACFITPRGLFILPLVCENLFEHYVQEPVPEDFFKNRRFAY